MIFLRGSARKQPGTEISACLPVVPGHCSYLHRSSSHQFGCRNICEWLRYRFLLAPVPHKVAPARLLITLFFVYFHSKYDFVRSHNAACVLPLFLLLCHDFGETLKFTFRQQSFLGCPNAGWTYFQSCNSSTLHVITVILLMDHINYS